MISKERATAVTTYFNDHGLDDTCRKFQIPEETVQRYMQIYRKEYATEEPTKDETLVSLSATKQRLADLNAVLRKENRESYRLYNSLEEIYTEYIKLLSASPFVKFAIPEHTKVTNSQYAIFHMSDLHLNEIILSDEANGNTFDFSVAAKRLQKFVVEAKRVYKCYGVTNVLVAGTGDFINSDRRPSEKLASATSQVRASLLATYLIQQVIIDLAQDFNVSVAMVVGNESRLGIDDFDSSDALASNNWDYLIFQQLRMLFMGKSVEFIEAYNYTKQVVTLDNGFNLLLIHGNLMKDGTSDKSLARIIQSYVLSGIPIHMVLCGHIHSASIGDILSRSASLCGGNAYSSNDLGCVSRASQNIYIVNADKGYHGMKIDLQNTDGFVGYNIIQELERYNVRGAK